MSDVQQWIVGNNSLQVMMSYFSMLQEKKDICNEVLYLATLRRGGSAEFRSAV